MPGDCGLFTRVDFKKASTKKSKAKHSVSAETLQKIGLAGVQHLNPKAVNPCMESAGSKRPLIYVLGTAPTIEDDKKNKHFTTDSGRWLRSCLKGVDVRYNFICRTVLPSGRQPTAEEIECFRESVAEDIAKYKPKLVLAVGTAAHAWCLGKPLNGQMAWRGRKYPCVIGAHEVWVAPVMDASLCHRLKDHSKFEKVPGIEWKRAFEKDIDDAIKFAEHCPAPEPELPELWDEGVVCVRPDDGADELLDFLEDSIDKQVAIDIETTGLRPYAKDSHILSIAIGTYEKTYSFIYDHPNDPWPEDEFKLLRDAVFELLTSGAARIAQNAPFEYEWFMDHYGDTKKLRSIKWHDTKIAMYCLDSRSTSLDMITSELYGFSLKDQSVVDYDNMIGMDINQLLRYNGMDTKYTELAWRDLVERMKKDKLAGIYKLHIQRIHALVKMTALGVPIDQNELESLYDKTMDDRDAAMQTLLDTDAVKKYQKRHGKFNPGTSEHVQTLLEDILGFDMQKHGKVSLDAAALTALEHPVADAILDLRKYDKLISTYLLKFFIDEKDTHVFPDNCLHASFNGTGTDTGRLSSAGPNMQNFPKRKSKFVRSMVRKDKHVILSIDYGQIEARVLAMASKDKTLCTALWDNYDIHMHWAKKIAEVYPATFEKRGGDMKAFRGDIKNQWTFPAFYGAKASYIARMLEIPDDVANGIFDEFWREFKDIKKYQERQKRQYSKHNFVECLTGRRRHGPLSENMVINTGIQGSSSDIVVHSMVQLSNASYEYDMPWLHPVINIHDDITFILPEKEVEETMKLAKEEMTWPMFDWINVPLTIECEMGKDWANMESIGEYSSVDVWGDELPEFCQRP